MEERRTRLAQRGRDLLARVEYEASTGAPDPGRCPAWFRRTLAAAAVLVLAPGLAGCGLMSPEEPGALVPPTADQDPELSRLRVRAAGADRWLHLQSFGEAENRTALAIPGGPGADHRLLLPLAALAEQYHVIVWSPRGTGLSERVGRSELALDAYLEEIKSVHQAVAPGERVTLIGHSWGAGVFLRYAAAHPELVDQLVMIEPGPLTRRGRRDYRGGAVRWANGQDFFWQNEFLSSSDHASADYKAVSLLPLAMRSFTCSGEPPAEYPMWRFGAYQYHLMTHGEHAPRGDFDWTEGSDRLESEILIVAGTCGAAGAGFQVEYNLPALPNARLLVVEGAGHLSLFTSHREEMLRLLRENLARFRP